MVFGGTPGNEAIGSVHFGVHYTIVPDAGAPNIDTGTGAPGSTALPVDSRVMLGITVLGLLAIGLSRLRRRSRAR